MFRFVHLLLSETVAFSASSYPYASSDSTHGYKEMLFPQGSGLIPHGLHIWPRNTHMLMALANRDGSMTGTLYMDTKGGRCVEHAYFIVSLVLHALLYLSF